MQELRFHGVELSGPSKHMEKTGASGKFKSNIKRDLVRQVGQIAPWPVIPCLQHVHTHVLGHVLNISSSAKVPLQMLAIPMKVHKLKKTKVTRNLFFVHVP